MKKSACFIVVLIGLLMSMSCPAQDNGLVTVSGVVKSFKSHHELEYVNVFGVGTNLGTVTNMDGIFTIKLRNAKMVEFSHIGYETLTVPLSSLNATNNVIYLKPKTVILNEVIVSPIDASLIVGKAVSRIDSNYNRVPSMLTGFYRETIQKRKKYINISEAVTNLYKTPYREDIVRDKVKILKGRMLVSPKLSDTLAVKLEGGPNLALFLDMVKNTDEFLSREARLNYTYSFVDYVTVNGRNHYAIQFEPLHVTEYPLYDGILYIDQENYTISRMEFKIQMDDPEKVTNLILKKKPATLHFKPVSLTYLVDYRLQGSRSFLNYVRSDIRFKCDWKKRLFHTSYGITTEMVMTDWVNNPSERISGKEAFKNTQVFSDKLADFYDDAFWGEYNIIEPTESLEHAVQKLKKSYGQ